MVKQHFLRVGVTGGIGSGKTEASMIFKRLGRVIISADDIARSLTESETSIQEKIRELFGHEVFSEDGRLDRTKLSEIVFSSPIHLRQLNDLIHPHVFRMIDDEISHLQPSTRFPFVVIEAALIFETGMDGQMDYVIVIDADEEKRIRRVAKRDRARDVDIQRRMKTQLSPSETRELADFVIENNTSLDDLEERVRFLNNLLTQLAGKDSS